MNVCIISSYPPPAMGIATYTSKLCSALASHGIKVTVFSNTVNFQGGKVTVIRAWNGDSLAYPLELFRQVASRNFDVIHIQHEYWLYGRGIYTVTFPLVLMILRVLRRPTIITVHCVLPRVELTERFFGKHGLGGGFLSIRRMSVLLYTKLMSLLSSGVVVHSEAARSILVNDYGFDAGKMLVIPHGVDDFEGNPCLNRDEAKRKLGFSSSPILLVFGEIRRGKGIEHAIKAMPRVLDAYPSSLLVVAGTYDPNLSPESGGYLEEITALSKIMKLDSNVAFRTNIPEDHIPTYFEAADITLFPYTEDEVVAASGPLSTSIAFGKPIIASNVKRFRDVLKDGENSMLVPPADATSLAGAINAMLGSRELMRKLSQGARLAARGRSWENVALKTLNLYDELVAK